MVGVASLKLTLDAVAGPLFVIACVYVMLFPASTLAGLAAVLRAKSACVPDATTTVAAAVFAPKDWLAAFTVTVSLMRVPAGTVAFTLYCTVNVAEAPAATVAAVHCGGNTVQDHPAGGVIGDIKVVFAGVISVKVAPVAAELPVFVTTCV